jgi:SAM-dependent methyltransferase
VNAAAEPLLFGLANRVRAVTAADEYGEADEAPAGMLAQPERFAPFPFPKSRLWVVKMAATRLGFPEDSFDFAVVCALHRTGGEEAARAALAECARVVRPGGLTVVVTEVGLNGVEGRGWFSPAQLSRIVHGSGLDPVEDVDFTIADQTLDAFVDLARGPHQRPHLVLAQGDVLFTSGVIVLERRAEAAVGTAGP